MANVIFRCPVTKMNVQHSLDEERELPLPENTFEAVHCAACTRLHFIDPSTGKLMGEKIAPPCIAEGRTQMIATSGRTDNLQEMELGFPINPLLRFLL
jgi:hypothetical protein